jgi:diguanylate cyclase (GGDEF)-like protein
LAQETGVCPPQEAFVGGLLSQIGRCLFASALPAEYEQVLARAQKVPLDLPKLEREVLGEDYASVGGHLLRTWGLPEALSQAIARFRDPDPGENNGFERVLQTAEVIATIICPAHAQQSVDVATGLMTAERLLNLPSERVAALITQVAKSLDEARATFELPPGKARQPEELEGELLERITELSLAMHLENQSLAQQQEDLLRRATTDALTGVGNRAAFDARLALELERSARCTTPIALLMIDVDKFKSVNDTYGHLAGDQVLKAVARTLDDNIRKMDYCARYGGEEFAVIAPAAEVEGIMLVAERLRRGVEATLVPWDGKTIKVTVSIGVGFIDGVKDFRPGTRDLVKMADEQLYAAKCGGRNRVCVAKELISN